MPSFIFAIANVVQESGPSTTYTIITIVIGLLVAIVALAIIAPRLKIPYPILLVFGGLLLGFVPGLPHFTLEPDLVFLLFLPPLLYASAWTTSWRDFRANLRPISLLAIGLVLMTTIVIALVAYLAIPGLPLAAAFVLGAIVSPTDAVAATSIAQRLGVPRRITTVIEGESLVNDSSGLVAYQFAVAAVVTGTFSLGEASLQFLILSVGGIALGLAAGWGLTLLHRALDNAPLEITITLLTPFAVYLLAEVIHVSGVLATVTTGLYLAWRAHILFSAETRQQALAVWNTLVFLLNGLVFILIGLQLRNVLDMLANTGGQLSTVNLVVYALVICLATVLVRILWVFPATYLPRLLSRRIRARDPYPGWRNVVIIAWTGMRGVVSLAAALALPVATNSGARFPERALILYLTFCVILVTLVFQGLSLPLLIRGLGLKDDGEDEREEKQARLAAARAALARIDELSKEDAASQKVSDHLRTRYQALAKGTEASLDETKQEQVQDHVSVYQRIQREALKAELQAVLQLRNRGDISDEVLRRIERQLDLEEQRLAG